MKFYPYSKRGGDTSFSHAEGGAQNVSGYCLHGSWKV